MNVFETAQTRDSLRATVLVAALVALSCGGRAASDDDLQGSAGDSGVPEAQSGSAGAGGAAGSGGPSGSGGAACSGADTATDPANCGSCGHDCQGGACDAGRCLPLIVASVAPSVFSALSLDQEAVYWIRESAQDAVWKWPKSGAVPTLVASTGEALTGIAPSDDRLYLTAGGTAGRLLSIPKAGGDAEELSKHGVTSIEPGLFGATVLWVDILALEGAADITANIMALDVSAGEAQAITAHTYWPRYLARDESHLYWVSWVSAAERAVFRRPWQGGTEELLASGYGPALVQAALDATHVYFTVSREAPSSEPSEVRRVPKSGGPHELIAQDYGTGGLGAGLLVDDTSVYWTHVLGTGGGAALIRAPLQGGAPAVLAGPFDSVIDFLLQDDCCLYFTTYDGLLRKIAK
jgi:hypothetical protein